jgi:hypothetical protein
LHENAPQVGLSSVPGSRLVTDLQTLPINSGSEAAAHDDTGRKPRHGERAQTTAEFVAVLPMLLILLFLVIEFGWLLKNYIVVTNASREVARCAAVNRCLDNGALVEATVLAESRIRDGAGIHPDDIPAILFSIHYIDSDNNDSINTGEGLIVCIQSPSRAVTPLTIFAGWAGVLPNPVPLKAKTVARVEIPYAGGDLTEGADSSCTPS